MVKPKKSPCYKSTSWPPAGAGWHFGCGGGSCACVWVSYGELAPPTHQPGELPHIKAASGQHCFQPVWLSCTTCGRHATPALCLFCNNVSCGQCTILQCSHAFSSSQYSLIQNLVQPTNSIPVNTYIAIVGHWTNTIGRVYRHVIRSWHRSGTDMWSCYLASSHVWLLLQKSCYQTLPF